MKLLRIVITHLFLNIYTQYLFLDIFIQSKQIFLIKIYKDFVKFFTFNDWIFNKMIIKVGYTI